MTHRNVSELLDFDTLEKNKPVLSTSHVHPWKASYGFNNLGQGLIFRAYIFQSLKKTKD